MSQTHKGVARGVCPTPSQRNAQAHTVQAGKLCSDAHRALRACSPACRLLYFRASSRKRGRENADVLGQEAGENGGLPAVPQYWVTLLFLTGMLASD